MQFSLIDRDNNNKNIEAELKNKWANFEKKPQYFAQIMLLIIAIVFTEMYV